MWTDENNDKDKPNLPLPPSTPVIVLLIAEKLLNLLFLNSQTLINCFKLTVLSKR